MYSEDDLEAAVAAGIVDRPTVERLRDFLAHSHRMPLVDEEHFRLISGFNDIFVSIASILLLVALGWLGEAIPIGLADGPRPLGGVLVAAASWGLAEMFTARRRMALPSILLLAGFVGGSFEAAAALFGASVALPGITPAGSVIGALMLAASAAVAALAAYLHWRRFHVPITIAAGAGALVAVALGLLAAAIPDAPQHLALPAFVAGLCVFALAMRWDISDPRRETRRSDIAFWLHLLAAPLIVHPVFAMMGLLDGSVGLAAAGIVVLLYVVLGLIALAIDRRALMVSALAYVLYALSALFREFGALSLNVALTALVLGSALLLLSAYWTNVRAWVLMTLPTNLRMKLPVATRSAPLAAQSA